MLKVYAPTTAILLTIWTTAACQSARPAQAPPLIQPGAPGEPSRVISPEEATDLSNVQHTPADVKFMHA